MVTNQESFKIIVLDDNRSTRNLAKITLEQHLSCKVAICSSAASLLELAVNTPPELFLLDIDIGKENSLDICKQLKDHPATENVPLVFLSVYKDPHKRVAALKSGGVDYIDKPFYPEELVTRIRIHISVHRLRLQNLARVAEQKSLLQVLCHDLVNPIFAAKSLLELRQESGNIDSSTINMVINCCQSSLDVIKNVRTEHSLISTDKQAKIETIALKEAFAESVATLGQRFEKKKVHLFVEVDEKAIVQIKKVVLVHNIINNLLTNALKFSHPEGKVLLQAYVTRNHSQSICVIEVIDNGIGMPPEILDHIFDDDAKVSRKGTDNEEGSGFGMPLVKRYVEKNNGSIQASSIEANNDVSSEAVGTTIRIAFPFHGANDLN